MDFDKVGNAIAGFITAILGVAIVAVILSQGANTVNVLGTFFSGLTNLLAVVISPVTGGSNFASGLGGTSTYAGEVTYGSSGSSANGLGVGLNINGLGSLGVSNNTINSLLNSVGGSSDSGDLIGGSFG